MKIRPFSIHIPNEALADLRHRLHATRWPSSLDDESWADGANLLFMQRLSHHWLHNFDWRAQEERLNRLPQFIATIDNADVHFVHQRGAGPSPMPIVLTHGWPGSFAEMEHIIPLLADPGAHGGDPADAFHVVVPSLPGYGFSPAPSYPGVNARTIAQLWHRLMEGLGYNRFAAQGGDIGAGVSAWLARQFPDSLAGVHVNYIPGSFRPTLGPASPPVTNEEQEFLKRVSSWAADEGAYAALQGTKPQTLAFSLTDSPVGLAAWIVEKFRSWSDCDGDIQRVFSLDTLLTDISIYWFGDSLSASLRLYKENRLCPLSFDLDERVTPPFGVALFPHELPMPPRSWVERVFDVARWTEMPAGGHFAALEQPELLAHEIRAFFRPRRQP
ncbi:MAG: epoxide hydrolase [Mesorhizobium sp.]|nr:epoxide hydrolase family protein [Mesorhizobium sp.]RUW36998.1 epoxide hydrolase [Mesorhizobium sp. M1E.F.Ca.ET.041.01.1.1]RWB53348.1 MAG: epoxide hydrolase [Mesorhizobium sp.]RWD86534.1 MAG: epoxide hydrolase [Mesorhizobium sp.]RWD87884.1 MAG: epoxide hydrolase [Mesorhizobium sp.]TIV52617.1 MAG: alpha/beta fold hydrolase [Mesorhizobium sp.]